MRDGPFEIETPRLILRKLGVADAAFILDLLNQESFLRFIGDRGVRSIADAREYIAKGPMASYERFGFGLYLVSLREAGSPVGICGLVKRPGLDDADLGFALLPQHCSRGYAREAAVAVLEHGHRAFGLKRIVAITAPGNFKSIAVLERLGFLFERLVHLAEHDDGLQLFARDES